MDFHRLRWSWKKAAAPQQAAARDDQPVPQEPAAGSPRHWMISVAWARTDCGMVSPSAWAVLRLMTKSNLVGCSTGRSAGLAPLRILST